MKNPALLLAAGVAALAGCAAPHKDIDMMTRERCTGLPCKLTVTVNGCNGVRTRPNILDVPAGHGGFIEWQIVSSGWTFTRNGVEFKQGGGGGFSSGSGGGSTTYRWHNNNGVKGNHRYNVNVTDGKQVCTEDPTIVNH